MEREAALAAFLQANGYADAKREPLPVDCSFRSYARLHGGDRRTLLMNSPPGLEPLEPFVSIALHLRKLGVSAPEIYAVDLQHGYALIEDFGDGTFTKRLNAGADPYALYALAIDALSAIQAEPRATAIDLPPYDLNLLMTETSIFVDWYWPAIKGGPVPEQVRTEYNAIVRDLLQPLLEAPTVLVLRDFHVDNLMTLSGRAGTAACGLLDFQDAVIGHPAYDLASLLQDARRDLDPQLVTAMLDRYKANSPGMADETAYYVLAVQRHLKVLGIFTRLSRRDGKSHHLGHSMRLWRLIAECIAAEPKLAPLEQWLDYHWPADARAVPPLPEAA